MGIFKPWLLLPPQWAHDLSPWALPFISKWARPSSEFRPWTWKGQSFKHPLGLAGGVDKNARNCGDWERLGASFIEVGTVTPRPQRPNPPPLLLRNLKAQSLWNKLGFPNEGSQVIAKRLRATQHLSIPLWINLGKNRDTPNDRALEDYGILFEKFRDLASSYVVNISSPNTTGLRDLQSVEFLKELLEHYHKRNLSQIPLLLKLSPDIDESDMVQLLKAGEDLGVQGWILCNTTKSRPDHLDFPMHEGGVSGAPLKTLALKQLKTAVRVLGRRESGRQSLLVSVGGIMKAQDVADRLEMGADLTQAYSALIFEGPYFFAKTIGDLITSRK